MRKYTTDKSHRKIFQLNAEGVNSASSYIIEVLDCYAVDHKDKIRLSLLTEEILLKWLYTENMGGSGFFSVESSMRFGRRLGVVLRCDGRAVDPRKAEDDELFGEGGLQGYLLSQLNLSPAWTHQNGENVVSISYTVKKKLGGFAQLLIAAFLAFILGFIGTKLPDNVSGFVLDNIFDPLFDTFLNLLSCIVGPMMFLSMICGICSIGEPKQLGIIGKKLIKRFFLSTAAVCLVTIIASVIFYDLNIVTQAGSSDLFKSLIEMVLGIVPKNIVEPFSSGNSLQILFLAIILGTSMLFLRDRVQGLSQILEQANLLVQFILSLIGSLVPYFVFLTVVRIVLRGTFRENVAGLGSVIVFTLCITIVCIIFDSLSLLKLGLSPIEVFKKLRSPFLTALATSSTSAAYSSMYDCAKNELGIDEKFIGFSLPLSLVVFKPQAAVIYIVVPLFVCTAYNIPLTLSMLVICYITAIILSAATPSVPNGIISCFALIFMQLGIPLDGISLAVAVAVLIDFPSTAGTVFADIVQLAHCANSMGRINKDILQKKS